MELNVLNAICCKYQFRILSYTEYSLRIQHKSGVSCHLIGENILEIKAWTKDVGMDTILHIDSDELIYAATSLEYSQAYVSAFIIASTAVAEDMLNWRIKCGIMEE